jgi:hypothetical protein
VTKRRKTLLIVAITIAGLLALVPPWNRTTRDLDAPHRQVTFTDRHRPLFFPPQTHGDAGGGQIAVHTYTIDLTRLALYWVVLGLLTTAIWVHFGSGESSANAQTTTAATASADDGSPKRSRLREVVLWAILIPVGALAFAFCERAAVWLRGQ